MIVLPDFVDAEGALSDAELEAVAGGSCTVTCLCATGAPCCVTVTPAHDDISAQ